MVALKDRDLGVLVLDSNEYSRQFLVSILKTIGIARVVDLASAEEALAWINVNGRPDVLVVDSGLKPMTGAGFTRYLRTVVGGREAYTPVILVAARADRDSLTQARNAGVNEFMAKPVSASGLSARLFAVLDAPRSFVRTAGYFGPDRRRRQVDFSGPNRRCQPEKLATTDQGGEDA
ncbi:MAG: response regulator [Rhodospirillum sp.]|nr:response regulator [Rhodospirillum sp.]MCF8489048.1 response regulator [Rhodospirillum sp.]MCF8499763.1 response regulator [Rhodospirillum sp.]